MATSSFHINIPLREDVDPGLWWSMLRQHCINDGATIISQSASLVWNLASSKWPF